MHQENPKVFFHYSYYPIYFSFCWILCPCCTVMSTTLSDAYAEHPLQPQKIVPLDFNSIGTVPDSHIWSDSGHDFESNDRFLIPTIDLNDPQDRVKLIGNACETWGVFQVVNHGIPATQIDEVESEARRLFSLPASQKLKALRSPNGVTGYGVARISLFFNKYMWHEGFTIIGSPIDHARELWPYDYHRFCDIMEDYQKKMEELAKNLMRLIFRYLAIPEQDQNWVDSFARASTALQLNSYPLCPDPDRAMGLAPHTDTSLLTILRQSTISGLQVFKEGVGWVLVQPTSGALVVNVGDLLHIISNAKFPNVVHRVVLKEPKQRLSLAFFYSPPTDFYVFPFGLGSAQFPLYRSVSVAEYVGLKAKHHDKALSLVRI